MGIENQVWSFKLLHNIRKHHKAELQTNLLLAKRPPCGLLGTVVMSQWLDYITSAVFPSLTDPIPQRICRNHNLFCLLFSILLFSSSYINKHILLWNRKMFPPKLMNLKPNIRIFLQFLPSSYLSSVLLAACTTAIHPEMQTTVQSSWTITTQREEPRREEKIVIK